MPSLHSEELHSGWTVQAAQSWKRSHEDVGERTELNTIKLLNSSTLFKLWLSLALFDISRVSLTYGDNSMTLIVSLYYITVKYFF